ncbi:GNAT family N-acetyltransferase [Pseudonocardia thermophila]|jgi:hypothetical protein|uniref:GNAT family N-acetyltransferase n=1 Tax=Pseudonocardia thermophila TaxID=1848 RepID=UPI00248DEC49|nr:GNAT family N-acetyltransferase [Pseudonocardia thermophila]
MLRTGWEDDTPSADTIALAAMRAMADRAAALAEAAGGKVRRGPGLVLADAGAANPFHNVATVIGPVDPAAVDEITGFFGGVFLLISPAPAARLPVLELMGHPPLMVRPPGGRAPRPAPGVAVTEVPDGAGLAVFDRVLSAGYPVPHSPTPADLLGGPTRFFLATVDGEPAATAMAHVGHGVVDVEAVAALPHLRGRGAGTAAVWAATLAAPELPAVLLASDDGVGIYRRMGYLALVRGTAWWRGQ